MKYLRLLCLSLAAALLSQDIVAQPAPDNMVMLGMAEFTELRRPYYIAALYAEEQVTNPDLMLVTQGRRRMEMRVTAESWRARRFSTQWTQAVLINNDPNVLLNFDDTFVQFNNLVDDAFVRGDIIVIDAFKDGTSKVWVGGVEAMSVKTPGFLELLLSKWIGQRPPSSEFKRDILGGQTAPGVEALFASLVPSEARVLALKEFYGSSVGGVRQGAAVAASKEPEKPPAVVSPAPVAPKPEPVVKAPVVAPPVAVVAAPEPKPVKPVAPKPKPEPIVEEEPEVDPELYAQQQSVLMNLYQTSVARRVLTNVRYPSRAVDRDQQASFQVVLTVDRAGNVGFIRFVEESRYKLLNNAAMDAIEKAGKMPPVPAGLDGDTVEVPIPFTFRLE